MVLSIALVWFSTHVGGGFASGVTLYSYFINYGIACLWLPIPSLAMIAFVYWWGWRHAQMCKVFDYRSFNDSFYGRFARMFSNLYEVLIAFVVVIGASVAFATGASVLESLVGVPYALASIAIGAVIFLVCIFGTHIVRRASAVFSALMIAALLLIYVPAIAMHAPDIAIALEGMAATHPDVPLGLSLPALGGAFMYGVYQASDVALYVHHMRPVRRARTVGRAMILSYFINLTFFMLTMLGLLTVAGQEGIDQVSVPLLVVIDGLPYAAALKSVAGLLISIACISTGVMFLSGMVKRLCVRFEGREATEAAEDARRPTRAGMIFTAACALACCLVAQAGLLPLVQQGYSLLAYMAIPVVTIPYAVNFVWSHTARGKAALADARDEDAAASGYADMVSAGRA